MVAVPFEPVGDMRLAVLQGVGVPQVSHPSTSPIITISNRLGPHPGDICRWKYQMLDNNICLGTLRDRRSSGQPCSFAAKLKINSIIESEWPAKVQTCRATGFR